MGLAQLDRLGAVRVGGGVQEGVRQAGRVLELGRRGTACGRCGGSHDVRSWVRGEHPMLAADGRHAIGESPQAAT